MDWKDILNSGAALIFVLALIGLAAVILKKLNLASMNIAQNKDGKKRLQIQEILHIDQKKKIVLISRDEKEHLIAFNESKIELIENIEKKK